MKIYIGADHRGFNLKNELRERLTKQGHDVFDLGTFSPEPCDYPIIAFKVAERVAANRNSKGILVCWSGIGHSIAANKVHGINAALCYNNESAVLSRQHNNANILILGSQFVKPSEAPNMVDLWLKTEFEGGRHLRRVKEIRAIEKKVCKTQKP